MGLTENLEAYGYYKMPVAFEYLSHSNSLFNKFHLLLRNTVC